MDILDNSFVGLTPTIICGLFSLQMAYLGGISESLGFRDRDHISLVGWAVVTAEFHLYFSC